MRCDDLHDDLSAWIDGELNADDRARVTAHLQSCRDCREYVAALQNISSLVGALPAPRAPASVTQTAIRQVGAMTWRGAGARPRRLLFAWPLPVLGVGLAGLAVAFALAMFIGRPEFANSPSENSDLFHSAASSADHPLPNGAGYHLSSAPDSITGTIPITPGYDFRGGQNRRDIGTFNARERYAWDHGTWRHERRFGRDGWWWAVEGAWYWYDRPAAGPPNTVSDIRFAGDSASISAMPQPAAKAAIPPQPR
jgi:Putative zinc-finger